MLTKMIDTRRMYIRGQLGRSAINDRHFGGGMQGKSRTEGRSTGCIDISGNSEFNARVFP